MFFIEFDLACISLVRCSDEEFGVTYLASFAHLECLLHLIGCHLMCLLSIDSFSLFSEHPHLVNAFLARFMTTEVAMVRIRSTHFRVTDYALSFPTAVIFDVTL